MARSDSDEVLHDAPGLLRACDSVDLSRVERRRQVVGAQVEDLQVLSLQPLDVFPELEAERGLAVCQRFNEAFAETVNADPSHFIGLAALPLQAPELAARELERAVRGLGLRGVEIGTNIDGKNLDDPGLKPFYAKAQE